MNKAEDRFYNMVDSDNFILNNEIVVCVAFIDSLKEEIRQKDELILKLQRKGY